MRSTLEQTRPTVRQAPRQVTPEQVEGDADAVLSDAGRPTEARRMPSRDQMWSRWA